MKYIKKPVMIEAIQFVDDNLKPMIEAWGAPFAHAVLEQEAGLNSNIVLSTLEGAYLVKQGDWIIKGVKGEFYPCKPDVFALTYEPAEAGEEK